MNPLEEAVLYAFHATHIVLPFECVEELVVLQLPDALSQKLVRCAHCGPKKSLSTRGGKWTSR